ncbi:hypothetical protein F0344_25750 [Streptomyces finlayi]|uniref:Uncharacterized protein n=1 Tax=Streptomyces finlayi TaxID=67296 RepID=A0A7G7BQD2_9ACTN|nr:hypothetical protein [Streptomyces finlayi]QNE77547.1 hypothetical protein F0344_25750 [Streptomyces finlayi]
MTSTEAAATALQDHAVLWSPRRDREHVLHWSAWRRHHQHQAAEAHRRWNNITAAATA